MVKICKSWEQQVLENTIKLEKAESDIAKDKLDIINLDDKVVENSGSIEEIKEDIVNINGNISSLEGEALKTLMSPVSQDTLVGIGSNNAQKVIYLGSNLSLEGNTLNATGGGGGEEMTQMAELSTDGEAFSLPGSECLISISNYEWEVTVTIAKQGISSYPPVYSSYFAINKYNIIISGYIESNDGECYLRITNYDWDTGGPISIYAKPI